MGLEPTTSAFRTLRASHLRHTPSIRDLLMVCTLDVVLEPFFWARVVLFFVCLVGGHLHLETFSSAVLFLFFLVFLFPPALFILPLFSFSSRKYFPLLL